MSPVHGSGSRNRNVQWLRAIAALFVVVYHASHYVAVELGDDRFLKVFGGQFGLIGVALFFAISGALMADLVRRTEPALFLAHRLVRIYPLFLLAYVAVSLKLSGDLNADVRMMSLALTGRRTVSVLGVEWTLIVEVFFYVVLFLLAALGGARRLEVFAVVWLVAIAVAAVVDPAQFGGTLLPTIAQVFLLSPNAAFAGGLLIPAILKRCGGFPPALATLAFAFGAVGGTVDLAYGRLFGAVAAVILVGIAFGAAPSTSPPSIFGRAMERLGDWSYALYLCHVQTILWVINNVSAPTILVWVLGIAAALAVSVPLGALDVALYRRLRAATDRADPMLRKHIVSAYVVLYAAVGILFLFKQH